MSIPAQEGSQKIPVDILLIEDSVTDVELAVRRLTQGGFECTYRVAATEAAMREALKQRRPSFILSDFSLPGFGGLEALEIASRECPEIPFLFLSGTMGEERAIEALRRGAVDYILKSNPKRLVPAVQRALTEMQLRRETLAAQRRAARLSNVLQMLSGINSAVVRIQDREALLEEACHLAHRLGGYPMAVISMVDSASRLVRPTASAGFLAENRFLPTLSIADSEDGDTSLISRVMRTGTAVSCSDIKTAQVAINTRDDLIAAGVVGVACLPLTVDDTPVGTFFVGSVEADPFAEEEMKLLREVAANLSFALQYLERNDAARFLAYFDPLTGLAKRTLFCERLDRLLARGAERLPQLAVNVLDIAHLSVINDSSGRHTGDRLLQCVADRIKGQCADTDRLAHLGGGTFIWLTALGSGSEAEIHELQRGMLHLFDAPFLIDGRDIAITLKCGSACFPQNGHTADELVQNAEAALKEAKASGEKYLHHRLEMNSALAQRVRMEFRLRTALQNNEFVLHYQPKLHIGSGKIVGAEALLRWQDPDSGLVAPGMFLPILESAGLMPEVSAWALRRALADARRWRESGLPSVRVAVNVSPSDLRRRRFAQDVLDAIGTLQNDADWGIDIEVTEGALYGDSSACVHALRLLRTSGIRVAIDDFGTGYSSLARLSELPIDSLKIDRLFVSRLPADPRSCTLVSTIIELAHAFGMSTVAEGVETQEQLECLQRLGCDESQGFLHSRAVAADSFAVLLSEDGGVLRPKSGA
jgi:diguanylate cyclase (GGDEF)-like protein